MASDPGRPPRPLPNRRADRQGRHGRGVPRPRHHPQARRGAEDPACRCPARSRAPGSLPTEAEVPASLDHPNIGPIHGIVESEDSRALVLALIEGPTLADRIADGPLPQDEALTIARQIIEALEYAHDRGVVHRDLKPANVKITPEGVVKVLDFGLAN